MTPDAALAEKDRLKRIRGSLAAIAPGQWNRAADADGEFLEARGEHGELLPVARFHPGATWEEMQFAADAPDNVRFLLDLFDRARRRVRELTLAPGDGGEASPPDERGRAPKDYAAEAAIKCQSPAFKAFLEARHGLEKPLTDERAAQRLRSLLGVKSRAELNDGGQALECWKQIRADFKEWRGRE